MPPDLTATERPRRSQLRPALFFSLPLGLQILSWFFLNILLLGSVAALALFTEFRPVLGALMQGKVGHRLSALAGEVTEALSQTSQPEWNNVLDSFAETYGVQFSLFRSDGAWQAGEIAHPPPSVLAKVRELVPRPPPPHSTIPGLPPGPTSLGNRHFVLHHENLYWIGVHLSPIPDGRRQRGPTILLLASTSPKAGGLLLQFTSWWIAALVLLASALFWIPLVRRITLSLRTMKDAAESMAAGHFETRVSPQGRDELGNLGESLNHLAAQLQDFVSGQKRFLGDIAHELCSPVARMEWSLGILEQQAGAPLQEAVQDVREEVAQMSKLIEELLCFTKAGLHAEIHLEPLDLAPILEQAARQEGIPQHLLQIDLPPESRVFADAHLLKRAVANVLRNAFRYSGGSLPIRIEARSAAQRVVLHILDEGPGVPKEMIHRLCEPFFRPETARTRETGGTGLGLAIVKSCLEACGGSIAIRNRSPKGLCVEFTLEHFK